MSDFIPPTPPSSAPSLTQTNVPPRPLRGPGSVVIGLSIGVAVGASVCLYWLLVHHPNVRGHSSIELLLAALALFGSVFAGIYQRRHWARPLRDLQEGLMRIREGEATIEELAQIRGGISPLIGEIQEILRDLRRQRAELARLDQETSLRVARRTDALERVVGSLRQQATRDPLTGLNNRRMLDGYLPEAVERSQTQRIPLCLLMIDVDDFKLLNDTLGHAAGDELLRNLGQIIRSNLRESDMAFRCGGDEFVIVLFNTGRKQAETFAKRLTSLVDAMGKTLHVPRPPRLSIGLATSAELGPAPAPAALLAEADKHLYQVKTGRKTGRRVA